MCVETINYAFCQYVNTEEVSDKFVKIKDLTGDLTDTATEEADTDEGLNLGTQETTSRMVLDKFSDSEATTGELTSEIYDKIVSNLEKEYALQRSKFKNMRMIYCPACPMRFKTRIDKRKHVRINHPTLFLYKCGSCGFKTNFSHVLLKHMRKGHNFGVKEKSEEDRRACPECQKIFKESDLSRHVGIEHPDFFLFVCDDCDFTTNYKEALTAHRIYH